MVRHGSPSARRSYRPDWSWLEVPVLDRKGQIGHDGGIVPSPGLYVMGPASPHGYDFSIDLISFRCLMMDGDCRGHRGLASRARA
jgi:hypothetical protein